MATVNINNSNIIVMSTGGDSPTTAQFNLNVVDPTYSLSPLQINNIRSNIGSQLAGIPVSEQTVEKMQSIAKDVATSELLKTGPEKLREMERLKYASNLAGVQPPDQVPDMQLLRTGSVPYNPNTDYDPNNRVEKVRSAELQARQSLPTPRASSFIGSDKHKTGSLQHVMSGSDLSVFLMAEVPKIEDMVSDIKPYLWQKELLLIELDSVMSLGYSIVREVFPVRSIGRSKPKSFTRGGISIAGHLAFAIFTDDVLVRLRTQMQKGVQEFANKAKAQIEEYKKQSTKDPNKVPDQATIDSIAANTKSVTEKYNLYNKILNAGNVYMLNQMLPFHLLVMGTNEHGNFSKMMIKGVRIIDENQMQGVAQPNIMNKVTFAAEDIFPMTTGGTTNSGEFTATNEGDMNNLSANKFSIYSGSQIMNDVAAMQSGTYRLGG